MLLKKSAGWGASARFRFVSSSASTMSPPPGRSLGSHTFKPLFKSLKSGELLGRLRDTCEIFTVSNKISRQPGRSSRAPAGGNRSAALFRLLLFDSMVGLPPFRVPLWGDGEANPWLAEFGAPRRKGGCDQTNKLKPCFSHPKVTFFRTPLFGAPCGGDGEANPGSRELGAPRSHFYMFTCSFLHFYVFLIFSTCC